MYLAKYIAKCESAEDIQLVKTFPTLGGQKRVPPLNAAVVPANSKDSSASARPVLSDQPDEPPPEKFPYGWLTKDDSDVKRFLKLRVVNILEAVMLCFGYPQVGCSREIIFFPVDLVQASRVVMKKKHREAAKGDSPCYDTKLDKYFARSELLEDVTYQQYFEQYYVKYDKKLVPDEPNEYARDDEEEIMRKDNSKFFVDQTAAKRKWVRRVNPARYAVGRFRYYSPHGGNVESYCLVKLLKAKAARRSTVEGWIAEFGSYLSACIHLGLVMKGAEALHFLEECAMERFGDLRLREMVERFKEQGWLEDPDIDGLLESWLRPTETIPLEDFLTNMTPSQRSAFTYATDKWEAGQPVRLLITGGAGVGKSYLLKALVAWLRDRHITFAKCATTGIAAHLIGGRTVHSFLGMDFEFNSRIQHGTFQAKALSGTQVVFVDEVSMMPSEALMMLDETLRKFNNQNNGTPFAGKSLTLLGDPVELQAVGKHIWREDQFSIFQVVVLREVKRQSDTPFIELLNRMRLGNLTDADMQMLAKRLITRERLIELDMTRGAVLFPFRKEKNAYNVEVLGRFHLSHYRAVDREANGDFVTSALSREYFALRGSGGGF
ncbi:putative ATP-dependent DNA helicase PIF1 [Hypsibius exemplaris]|uniref:ATP-dependent DNA helicase n=1 Tax=Hypsibius exemplaris TaxID=2072580 RepID=A0A9X6RKI3_HYPEX|nr:putative ATP-dependent DNA helicase PIF1 [Hypsibius exemplaris]